MQATPTSLRRWALSGLVLLTALLAGCATGPRPRPDMARVRSASEPVPRALPRSAHGNPASYTVFGKTYHVLKSAAGYDRVGMASWYGPGFNGERTSSGERYNMYGMTAANKVLPLPTFVRVTNLQNGRHVIVKVNDRGPFHPGRIIDLSYTAAYRLGMTRHGTALVRVQAITPGRNRGNASGPSRQFRSTVAHDRQTQAARARMQVASDTRDSPTARSIDAVTTDRPPEVRPSTPAGHAAPSRIRPAVAPLRQRAGHATPKPVAGIDRYVQVGAFGELRHARERIARLRRAGFRHAFIEHPRPGDHLYRVRLGPFYGPARADDVRARVRRLGIHADLVSP